MFPLQTRALLVAAILGTTVIAAGCAATQEHASTGQTVDDSVITAKVKAKLIDDPVTKARQISVETFKGTVQLSGFVDTAESKARAEAVAKGVDGVQHVKNSLVVKPAA
jgi:osmotically-inducible protein OsmY